MGYRCKTGCGRWGVFDGFCHACARNEASANPQLQQYENDRVAAQAASAAPACCQGASTEGLSEFVTFDKRKHGVSARMNTSGGQSANP